MAAYTLDKGNIIGGKAQIGAIALTLGVGCFAEHHQGNRSMYPLGELPLGLVVDQAAIGGLLA